MKSFPHGNVGPYDAEVVNLVMEIFGVLDADEINLFIDNLNDIFKPVIDKAWKYEQLND